MADNQWDPPGDFQRGLEGDSQPLASQTSLDILRAKLTGGDLDGIYVKVDDQWRTIEDVADNARVMRGGEWIKADKQDIIHVLLGPADWDRNRVVYEREIYGGCSACSNRFCRDGDVCGRPPQKEG